MSRALDYIADFLSKYFSVPTIYLGDILEIIVISVSVYYIMLWIKKTKAWVLLKGISVIVIFTFVASIFNLTTLLWIINKALNVGIIAIVIIFQPELRRALELLGRRNVFFNLFKIGSGNGEERFSDKSVDEITRATLELAKAKTGALMVIEQDDSLVQYEETGIRMDANITSQLLINIFEKNTPLHDGAIIISGDKISSATCYLPLSDSSSLSKDLGTRHRAGLGISEVTDSVVIIVSEETGSVSIAKEGRLIRYADASILKTELIKAQDKEEAKPKKKLLKGKNRNGKHEE